jgi:hypothetical protein
MFLVVATILALPIASILYRATATESVAHLVLVLGQVAFLAPSFQWLWRRSQERGSMAAAGAAAIFAVSADAPVLGWALFALALGISHQTLRLLRSTTRRPSSAPISQPANETQAALTSQTSDSPRKSHSTDVDSGLLELKPIDDLAAPYERLLLCERLIRASLAVTLVQVPLNFPSAMYEAWRNDASVLQYALMAAAWLFATLVGGVALWLIYATLRGFSHGSRRIAWVWTVAAIIVIPWGVYGWFLEATGQQIRDGTIWVFLLARLEPMSFFILAGIIGGILVRHSEICRLRSDLRSKHLTVWQASGVIKPTHRGWRVLLDEPFALSVCALLLDGTGFHGYNLSASWLRENSEAFAAYVPTALPVLEAHYFYLTGLSMLVVPLTFLWMRGALAAAERVRRRARHSAVLSAEQALERDARAPVLFLRPFADVSRCRPWRYPPASDSWIRSANAWISRACCTHACPSDRSSRSAGHKMAALRSGSPVPTSGPIGNQP